MSSTPIFQDQIVVDGILQVKNCIKNIDNSLNERGMRNKFGSLSSYKEEIKNLKSPKFSNVSLNDLYTFKNGVLYENTDQDYKIEYKTLTTTTPFKNSSIPHYYRTAMVSAYWTNISANNNLKKFIKRTDLSSAKNMLHETEKYFRPTVLRWNDYDYFLENTHCLSSVKINCDYLEGGLNYAFRNCKNLVSTEIKINKAHYEIISETARCNGCYSLEDVKKSSYFDSERSNKYISSLIIPTIGIGGVGPETRLIGGTTYTWGCKLEPTTPGPIPYEYTPKFKGILYKAFEGCDNLKIVSLPDVYFNDIFDYSGENQDKLTSTFEISSYFGISPSCSAILRLKDVDINTSEGGYASEDKKYICLDNKIVHVLSTDYDIDSDDPKKHTIHVSPATYYDGDNNRLTANIIGKNAFSKIETTYDCASLYIENGILSVEDYAFGTTSEPNNRGYWNEPIVTDYLTKRWILSLPSGLKYIGNGAFSNCRITENFTIPSSVEHIGENALRIRSQLVHRGSSGSDFYPITVSVTFEGKTLGQVKSMENYPFGLDKYALYSANKPRYQAPNVTIHCTDGSEMVCWNEQ